MESRESLKNVSLGTSKINYLDPRCVAACGLGSGSLCADVRFCSQHLGGVVQEARGSHRENLHQGAAGEVRGASAREPRRDRASDSRVHPAFAFCCSGPWRRTRSLIFKQRSVWHIRTRQSSVPPVRLALACGQRRG